MNPSTCSYRLVTRDPAKGVQEMHGALHHKAHMQNSAVKNIFMFGSNRLPECYEGYSDFTEAAHILQIVPRLYVCTWLCP